MNFEQTINAAFAPREDCKTAEVLFKYLTKVLKIPISYDAHSNIFAFEFFKIGSKSGKVPTEQEFAAALTGLKKFLIELPERENRLAAEYVWSNFLEKFPRNNFISLDAFPDEDTAHLKTVELTFFDVQLITIDTYEEKLENDFFYTDTELPGIRGIFMDHFLSIERVEIVGEICQDMFQILFNVKHLI